MSERAPSAPPAPESTPDTPPTEGVDPQAAEQAAEDASIEQHARSIEDAANKPPATPEIDVLALTPQEQSTKARLETVKEARTTIREAMTPAINKIEARMNTVGNKRDVVTKKAFMLEYREAAGQRKTARLSAKLDKATPGTAKYRRLSRKYGMANIRLRGVRTNISRLDKASTLRTSEHDRKQELRQKEIQLRRNMLKIEKKVAYEKKNRRKARDELSRTSNEIRHKQLKSKIDSWQSIGTFRQELIDVAMQQYKQPLAQKEDYDLTA